ncbi:unnamed protein product, partial [Allacma fusca]
MSFLNIREISRKLQIRLTLTFLEEMDKVNSRPFAS